MGKFGDIAVNDVAGFKPGIRFGLADHAGEREQIISPGTDHILKIFRVGFAGVAQAAGDHDAADHFTPFGEAGEGRFRAVFGAEAFPVADQVGTTLGVQSTNTMQLPVQLYGVRAVDLLINTSWGNPGSTNIFLTWMCSDGSAYTNSLVEGMNTRDWLENIYDNLLTSSNSVEVFSGSSGGLGGGWGRIDKQHISLPERFASLELTNIVLTDTGVTGNNDSSYSLSVHAQRAFLYGITATLIRPVISIANHTNYVGLSWPTNAAGFLLQSTTNLVNPNWTVFPITPVIQGDQFWVSNQITNQVQFFRLVQPAE